MFSSEGFFVEGAGGARLASGWEGEETLGDCHSLPGGLDGEVVRGKEGEMHSSQEYLGGKVSWALADGMWRGAAGRG